MESLKILCGIVDDEPIARGGLRKYVLDVPFLHLAFEANNGVEASGQLQKHRVDVLFLDIEMPKLNGIELLKTLNQKPLTIITTAYPQYALEGFELDVIDYLLKPISFQRFMKSVNKARSYFELANNKPCGFNEDSSQKFFFVKSNRMIEKVHFEEISFIEAMLNYVIIHTSAERIITYSSLSGILESLPDNQFIKVHKSYIVNVNAIIKADSYDIYLKERKIPIGQSHKEKIKALLAQFRS